MKKNDKQIRIMVVPVALNPYLIKTTYGKVYDECRHILNDSFIELVANTEECDDKRYNTIEYVIDDEGKLKGLSPNIPMYTKDGVMWDVLCGVVIIANTTRDGDWKDMTDEQIGYFYNKYSVDYEEMKVIE